MATDLAQHFRHFPEIHQLSLRSPADLQLAGNEKHRELVQCLMMTSADLGASTKPWAVHSHVSQLVAEEFWAQGDLERETFHENPPPMMDRQASLASVQIDFLDNVCKSVYEDMTRFNGVFRPLLEGCLENRRKWVEAPENGNEGAAAAQGRAGKARNL